MDTQLYVIGVFEYIRESGAKGYKCYKLKKCYCCIRMMYCMITKGTTKVRSMHKLSTTCMCEQGHVYSNKLKTTFGRIIIIVV